MNVNWVLSIIASLLDIYPDFYFSRWLPLSAQLPCQLPFPFCAVFNFHVMKIKTVFSDIYRVIIIFTAVPCLHVGAGWHIQWCLMSVCTDWTTPKFASPRWELEHSYSCACYALLRIAHYRRLLSIVYILILISLNLINLGIFFVGIDYNPCVSLLLVLKFY